MQPTGTEQAVQQQRFIATAASMRCCAWLGPQLPDSFSCTFPLQMQLQLQAQGGPQGGLQAGLRNCSLHAHQPACAFMLLSLTPKGCYHQRLPNILYPLGQLRTQLCAEPHVSPHMETVGPRANWHSSRIASPEALAQTSQQCQPKPEGAMAASQVTKASELQAARHCWTSPGSRAFCLGLQPRSTGTAGLHSALFMWKGVG